MFGRRFELFRVFGVAIRIDVSWFVIAVLVTWSLAAGLFPARYPGLFPATYWWMGLAGSLGLFVSVILHELSHALVARSRGLPMRGITLFIFGGVTEMAGEPQSPRTEFWVAIAGPIASLLVSAVCLAGFVLANLAGVPPGVTGVLGYLALINLLLLVFNLLPAFPLDGGRVLRSLLWHWKGSLRWATRVTSRIGSGFGLLLILGGVFHLVRGNFVGGLWWCLIGLFLRNAAQMSYQQLLVRRMLEGEPVARFMESAPVSVPRGISIRELIEDYVYRHHYRMFPVVDGERLVGCVSTRRIGELPRDEWDRQTVGTLAEPCTPENTVGPGEDAMYALDKMSRSDTSRLMVVEGDRLVGIITLKDLLKFLSLKIEMEGAGR